MIKWCNENQGFFSALLCTLTILTSILTIFFTWKVGTLPYKKKLTVMAGYWGSDEDGHNLRISIVNVGRIPVYIRSVEVESYKGDLLGNMATMDLDKNFLIINPNEIIAQEICVENTDHVFDRYGVNLNNHIKITVTEPNSETSTYLIHYKKEQLSQEEYTYNYTGDYQT